MQQHILIAELNHKLNRLVASRRLIEALDLCIKLTQAYPQSISVWLMRGDVHIRLNEYDSAIRCSQRVIAQLSSESLSNPYLIKAYQNLGVAYINARRIKEALNVFDRLVAANPNDAFSHEYIALARLLLGDFQRGWIEFEWRLKTQRYASFVNKMQAPRWCGEPLIGKTILVNVEQGLGDTVQFVRYLTDVKACGGIVVLNNCQPELHRLLAGCEGADHIVDKGNQMTSHDVQTMLLSLPGIFQTSLETIPANVPYLRVPPDAGTRAVAIIAQHTRMLRVGLVWAGSSGHPRNSERSMSLDQFGPLFDINGAKFFSLQKGDLAAQLRAIPLGTITDLGLHLTDFADTAAAIQELDLVISVDTAVAHVAGALAKPVWTLIPFAPDWRWMLDREDTPWYPTMRLFRQPRPGDWRSVIGRVAAQLTELVQQQLTT